jgi:hypothetical protein
MFVLLGQIMPQSEGKVNSRTFVKNDEKRG